VIKWGYAGSHFFTCLDDIFGDAWFYGDTGWLGLATIDCLDGSTIKSGWVQLNRSYLDSGYDDTAKSFVACQELGHLMGLDHQNDASDTCMSNSYPAFLTVTHPNQHDLDEIAAITP
jgi:hypothetical protein